MNAPSNMALSFTAKKVAMNQLRSGVYRVTMDVEPEQMPTDFMRSAIDSEWQIASVRLSEAGKPVPAKQPEDDKKKRRLEDLPAPQQAALYCQRTDFQEFIADKSNQICVDEKRAADILRKWLKIESRSELVLPEKDALWRKVRNQFDQWQTDKIAEAHGR